MIPQKALQSIFTEAFSDVTDIDVSINDEFLTPTSSNMEDLLTYLNTISPITPQAFDDLKGIFKPLSLKKGDYFARQGKCAKKIGFLKKGIVRAFFLNQEGKEYTKQFFVGFSIIGAYGSLLTKQPNRIAQQALTNCDVLVANFADVESLYDKYHSIERLGRKVAELYFLEKEKKEVEMALLDATKRYVIMQEDFPAIETVIPQYYIASYLGISPTQLSRIRRKMKDA